MLDVNLIRENPEKVKDGISKKGASPQLVDNFLTLDKEWREITKQIDDLRAKQNKLSKERNVEEGKKVKDQIQYLESSLKDIEDGRQGFLEQIPNLPLPDVSEGKDESENVVLREVGEKPKMDFEPKDHLELGKILDLFDFERGAKVAGSNFYYLKNAAVALEFALIQYAFRTLAKEGFTAWLTPDLARERFYTGIGYLPRGPEAQIYEIKDSDLGLSATAEITLAGIHADEILDEEELAKKYVGFSHSFRVEAGGYGKFSKGLYRTHQFSKVEMFIYCLPDESPKMHQLLLDLEEKLWQGLNISYRVVEMCTGDLGAQAAKKYDLEAWMPGRNDWGEVTSTSNTTDYQARRLNIRYRKKDGSLDYVHTLNGTAIATGRAIIAVLENYQTKEGKIIVPEVLRDYVGAAEIGFPKKT